MRILFQPSINYNNTRLSYSEKKTVYSAAPTVVKTAPQYYTPVISYINFTSMKKTQFDGTDRLAVEQFKAPIEKFKTKTDFNTWTDGKYGEFLTKDYEGKDDETKIQRKLILNEWDSYLTEGNKEYTPAEKLIIINGITKTLKPTEATIPPVLNKGVLADTIYNLKKELKTEKIKSFDFEKKYLNNLREYYMDEVSTTTGDTKWIKIPSKEHDSENFEQNVEKLKTLSHKSWCTKSNNAEPYLAKGDFHIFLENGQPKLGIRFNGDKITEIQGEKNNGQIPLKYYDIFETYLTDNNFNKLEQNAKDEIKNAKIKKQQANALKTKLKKEIENDDYISIYKTFGITSKTNKDGTLTLMEYQKPTVGNLTLSDIGLSEGHLFKKVSKIHGNIDLDDSELKSLYNLKHIGGNLALMGSQLEDFGKLETIGGSLTFNEVWDKPERAAKVTSLKNIREIGGELDIAISNITDLGALKTVGGDVFVKKSNLKTLNNLEYIGGTLYLDNSSVETLGKLKEIGGDANFRHSALTDLGNLEKVGGSVDLKGTQVKTLKNLKYVGNLLVLTNSSIEDLGKLEKVMGYISLNRYLYDKKTDIAKYLDGSDF